MNVWANHNPGMWDGTRIPANSPPRISLGIKFERGEAARKERGIVLPTTPAPTVVETGTAAPSPEVQIGAKSAEVGDEAQHSTRTFNIPRVQLADAGSGIGVSRSRSLNFVTKTNSTEYVNAPVDIEKSRNPSTESDSLPFPAATIPTRTLRPAAQPAAVAEEEAVRRQAGQEGRRAKLDAAKEQQKAKQLAEPSDASVPKLSYNYDNRPDRAVVGREVLTLALP